MLHMHGCWLVATRYVASIGRLGIGQTVHSDLPLFTHPCRGDQASAADVSELADAALFSSTSRHAAPLAVAASGSRMGGQQMLATLLSNDQVCEGCTGEVVMLRKALACFVWTPCDHCPALHLCMATILFKRARRLADARGPVGAHADPRPSVV